MNILWLKTELLHLIDKGGKIRTYNMVRQLRAEHHHLSYPRRRKCGGQNHDKRLWALVNFEIWQRQFVDGEGLGDCTLPNADCRLEESPEIPIASYSKTGDGQSAIGNIEVPIFKEETTPLS